VSGADIVIGEYFQDYTAVLIATVAGTAMVLTAFFGSRILAPQARSAKKDIPYECGIEPTGTSWGQMHFRYYLFAILFLIFDVEAVFLFPWAVIFLSPELTSVIFYEMLMFVGILFFGLVYCWKKGILEWS
jgi:NADH-quinone oxidoreductase subunit A